MTKTYYAGKTTTFEVYPDDGNIAQTIDANIRACIETIRLEAIGTAKERAIRATTFTVLSVSHSIVNIPRDSSTLILSVAVVYTFN